MKKVLVVNNNDSFVYNLVEMLRPMCECDVMLVDELFEGVEADYEKILLSPGAGVPTDYPQMMQLIRRSCRTHSILGVCLGHQAIGISFGASLMQQPAPKHGHRSTLEILDRQMSLLKNIPQESYIARYHSWVIDPTTVPDTVKVSALDEEGNIMIIKHLDYKIYGVQFHPESIITSHGAELIANWVDE